eukprot:745005-Pelagomonas_calceolata.AAC.3
MDTTVREQAAYAAAMKACKLKSGHTHGHNLDTNMHSQAEHAAAMEAAKKAWEEQSEERENNARQDERRAAVGGDGCRLCFKAKKLKFCTCEKRVHAKTRGRLQGSKLHVSEQ